MATNAEWRQAYARQAKADFNTFQRIQFLDPAIPECHRLQFLQMACEKLVKAHLFGGKTAPNNLQMSHAVIAKHLPVVLRERATTVNYKGKAARAALDYSKKLSHELEMLAPAVKRGGKRPDNCEYPWEDDQSEIHAPIDWTFTPTQLLIERHGRTVLRLIAESIDNYVI
ncbi:MAG: hypothetical protein U1D30_25250 [Planctomycetota bacterium]